ncbi:MAG: hypothetical protein KY455_05500 [Euryarchaeota archaeon]|nr:hypothetical protein [Euryarchaeota archaeon]
MGRYAEDASHRSTHPERPARRYTRTHHAPDEAAPGTRLLQAVRERLGHTGFFLVSLPPARFLALLVLLHLVLVVPLLFVTTHFLPLDRAPTSDVHIFNERAAAILSGDFAMQTTRILPADTPPLVNYLLVPAYLMGGTIDAYGTYLSFFPLLAAGILYLGLHASQSRFAVGAALLTVTHPTAWATSTLMAQDEVLLAPVFALVLVGLVRMRLGSAAAWTGVGVLTKAWTIIGAPIVVLAAKGLIGKSRVFVAGILPALVLGLPFLLLAPEYMAYVTRFYGGGVRPDRDTPSGISFWRFLADLNGGIAEAALIALLAVVSVVLWWLVARRWMHPLAGYAAVHVVFFLLYPKIHFGYYLFLVIALLPFLVARARAAFLLLVLPAVAGLTHLLWLHVLPGSIQTLGIRLVLSSLTSAVVIATAWTAARHARSHPSRGGAYAPPSVTDNAFTGTVTVALLGALSAIGTVAVITTWGLSAA